MRQGQVQSGLLESLVQRVDVFQYENNPLRNNGQWNSTEA
jgi:hypothetical protein